MLQHFTIMICHNYFSLWHLNKVNKTLIFVTESCWLQLLTGYEFVPIL